MKVYIRNQQRLIKANLRRISALLRRALSLLGLHRAEVSILLVNDRRMRILNLQYRGIDRTTDVLSFPLLSADELKNRIREASFSSGKLPPSKLQPPNDALPLGDIVINLHKARRQAEEYGVIVNEEVKRLLMHGLLHLIGYDHEKSEYLRREMEKKELELLRNL